MAHRGRRHRIGRSRRQGAAAVHSASIASVVATAAALIVVVAEMVANLMAE